MIEIISLTIKIMTKNYCDKCKDKILNDGVARLSFTGHVRNKFIHDTNIFCEECFTILNTEIKKFIGLQTTDKI